MPLPANAIDFTTTAAVKAQAQQSSAAVMGNADDDLIQTYITAASRFLLKQMNRQKLAVATYIERFSGNGEFRFTPRVDPLATVTSVIIGQTTVPVSSDGISAGYVLRMTATGDLVDAVELIGYTFDHGRANCVVTYTAGFAAIPEDAAQACVELALMKYRRRKRIGMLSEALPSQAGTASYMKADVTEDIQAVIDQYSLRF